MLLNIQTKYMKKILLVLVLIFAINKVDFAQVWNDDINGIDSIWNVSVGEINPISMNHIFNYNDSVLYMGGGFVWQGSFQRRARLPARWRGIRPV